MMACKRKADDFDASEVKESKNVVVHGVITELSPVKKSRKNESIKYFSGQLCDGKDSVRVIYFEPCLREKMSCCFEKKEPVCLSNCQVRSGARGGSEVLLNKLTQVAVSPKKFDTNAAVLFRKESASVGLNDLSSLVMDADVTVTVKVKSVDPVEEVKNRDGKVLKKQDCVVGDADGCGRLVLWEGDVGKVTEGGSYKLVRVTVKSFRDVNYLSVGQYCEILSSGRYWRDGGS
jgi:ssDNA-binding replication factor A large subunit